jgi:microsomal dipeptidase-like Zn-dependent dipeptidase
LSRLVDRAVNRTARPGRLPASEVAAKLVRTSPVIDLVVGSALFRDTFVAGSRHGHVDLPRLKASGTNVVGLTIATAWPDLRGSLSRWQFRSLGMPPAAVGSNMGIAEWLIERIRRWCSESDGQLQVIRSPADLQACLVEGGPVGVCIGVQGGHVLDGDAGNIARLWEAGIRMFAPAHVMDNALVGSSTGRGAGGLTDYGRDVIAALEEQSIIVDLSHMSLAGIAEALPALRRPFVMSHTGLTDIAGGRSRWRRYSPATRNIPASVAAEVAAAGGLVGIVLSTDLLGGSTLDAAVRAFSLAVESCGEEHVAIGSDMDGALRTVIDIEGLPALADALLGAGMPDASVSDLLGLNAARMLRTALPG